MSLKFNNSEINEVSFNNQEVTEIKFNGTTIWKKEEEVIVPDINKCFTFLDLEGQEIASKNLSKYCAYDATNKWLKIKQDCQITSLYDFDAKIFCVGGGGGGGGGDNGGAGGGGGYCNTFSRTFIADKNYVIAIGEGGDGGKASGGKGGNGGRTSITGLAVNGVIVAAAGGKGGGYGCCATGGDGGSGGGGGDNMGFSRESSRTGGDGGTNGGNGKNSSLNAGLGGKGQGTTTVIFGDKTITNTKYRFGAGGGGTRGIDNDSNHNSSEFGKGGTYGGGASNNPGSAGIANTGGGGGGAGMFKAKESYDAILSKGGAGGSGVIFIKKV